MSMASEELTDRVRALVAPGENIREKKMFGANAFMSNGNMLVAAMRDGTLLVRVGKDGMDEALARDGTSVMEMGGRTMGGFVVVSGDALEEDFVLGEWLDRARAFVKTLPPK